MSPQEWSSSGPSPWRRWRAWLQVISVVVAVEIALHSFIVNEPAVTLVLATLWLLGFFWTRRGGRGGPILIGVLSLLELVGIFFASDEAAPGVTGLVWILAVHVVLVGAALVAVVMTLKARGTAGVIEDLIKGSEVRPRS